MSRPSLTARRIALAQLLLARDPKLEGALPEGAAARTEALLRAAGQLPGWQLRILNCPAYLRFAAWAGDRFMPGVPLHVAMRKRFFEEGARAALGQGVRQVLALGAGYDTLCWQLAEEFPEVCWIETDSPATSAVKRRGIEALGLPENLHLLGVDLARRDLGDVLEEQASSGRWDPEAPALVLAEAVLMYVPPEGVDRFLRVVRERTGVGTRLLFTFLPRDEAGVIGGASIDRFTRWSLRWIGEPFLWGLSPGELDGFLAERGWRVVDHPDLPARRARWLAPRGLGEEPVGDIEDFVEAEAVSLPAPTPRSR